MKKLVVLTACAIVLIVGIVLLTHTTKEEPKKETTKYNSKIYFENDGKKINEIKVKKNKEFNINIVFQTDSFDLYAIASELNYDKNKIELVDYEGLNNFTVVKEAKILAYRGVLTDDKNVIIMKLTFKANENTTFELKNPRVGNDKEEFDIETIKLKVIIEN